MDKPNLILNLLAKDSELIPYRKSIRKITGSVTSAILLQQIIHRAKQKYWEPFFKFRTPCKHRLYKQGDSWTEELAFSRREFDTALKRIATKVKRGMSKLDVFAPRHTTTDHLVAYWTDSNRVTWYQINITLLDKVLSQSINSKSRKSPIKAIWSSKIFRKLRRKITPKLSEKLKALPYPDFLATEYWDTIRNYMLHQANHQCQLCNSSDTLHVHHKTYEHHGDEHNHLEDLIVLCKGCHEKVHDKVGSHV